jgi:acyl-CoA synthetase (AMP-forming)/AMP-acid ligase II
MSTPTVGTCVELLDWRARLSGELKAFRYGGEACSFSELRAGADRFAAYLLQQGLKPGERVMLALPNGRQFFFAFYGTMRAGAVAVPLFPESSPERLTSIARRCGARFLVLPPQPAASERTRLRSLSTGDGPTVISPPEDGAEAPDVVFPLVQPDDIAFIQYTSGSTGDPKGVPLTHANLLANVRQMIAGMQITDRDRFVSWLPVYHDMGLILMTMVPFYLAAELHLLPTDLRSIHTWLEAIHEHRGTCTAAPDFAYRLCLRVDRAGSYDLSSLRVALNAAEPVRASTIESFHRTFGLQPVMTAGYGLAEATVGVAMSAPGTLPRVDGKGIVSVGLPFPGVEIKILENDSPAPTGRIGEIVIRSVANTRGYFDEPEATSRLFWGNGFIRSGDFGYLDSEGYLYVVGRKKNVIKVAGETIAPREVEEFVDRLEGIRFCAAVGVDKGGRAGEQIYVFAEVSAPPPRDEDTEELALRIAETVHSHLGYRPGRVYLLRSRSIPRTSNGKIQYEGLKRAYLDGSLRADGAILYPDF